ncbi:MAG TPA: YncE family protein [candidate division Zixibacteria bacterium]|nr:YncE family protein [candidate division Zixibacteria bacterium]
MYSGYRKFAKWTGFVILVLALLGGCERTGTGDDHGTHTYGHLYVLNQNVTNPNGGTIFVYNDSDLSTRVDSFGSAIPQPHWMIYDPNGANYYIVSRTVPGRIAKFDALTNALIDTITTAGSLFPTCMAVSGDGVYGYLCDFTSGTTPGHIHRYNLNTMTFVDSVLGNGAQSHDLMFTQDYSKLVAVSRSTDDVTIVSFPSETVVKIPLDSNNVIPISPVYGPYGVHIDHKDSLAYVNCLLNGQVRIVDLKAERVIDSVLIPFVAGCNYSPNGPTMSTIAHDDSKVYVTTQCGNSLVVISTATRQIITTILFSTDRAFGVTQNHDGSRVYVACANADGQPGRIYVIDGVNLEKLDSIDVGINSFGLYWHEH